MKITFNNWSADELIQAVIDFVKNKSPDKPIYIKYKSNLWGIKETLQGRITHDDKRLKNLPKKIQYEETRHELELSMKDWKIEFVFNLTY